jgi:hypothetical protein
MQSLIKVFMLILVSLQCVASESQVENNQLKFDINTEKAFSKKTTITQTHKGLSILHTSEGYANVMLSRINVNGKIETFCTNDKNKAKRFLLGEDLETITGRLK